MEVLLPESIVRLRHQVQELTLSHIAPQASQTDQDARWPLHSMQALAEAGVMGLHVPKRFGGHEQGLLALAVLGETIAQGCTSSALCYAMHCVGSAVITAKATAYHEEKYLVPIAENRHITTLALSEHGTGAHFYLPQTELALSGAHYIVNGTKQFVTNGGHADSYVISTMASAENTEDGDFSCLIVDRDSAGITWLEPWAGLGMRGNSSRAMQLNQVRLPRENLLGQEGDQIWYTFEVVAPYFLIAMAGAYLGLAQAALNATIEHVKARRYSHSGERLADIHTLQYRLAEMNIAVHKSRGLLYQAAYQGDVGDPQATNMILMAKADAADLAVAVTNDAMTCCGGFAYRENGQLSRLLRDARAAHVMSPTTDILKLWSGRLLLDLPLI
ncbi:MAG: acyl-CoA dehydrogenase family protein [Ketobacter sp.]|uniref:acyl-CoA dehydrogenase family protein n=1 Tax=unclassified Ketobacter TaxID=2639109 RepID=UPI000F2A90A7|nr:MULTISPECIES: acyl-CoA dehydrogenase family protein [unclassified Ketobacter]MCK5789912.1 acyl-CoA/acyl-ACP dehydrogenase [Ketobacter sp.]RLT89343.1 MAG: acyl-CoA dehydrogenase [Ketobacter sp. GenoA1]RLT95811.1 MAG: acyl-CoA dehydrogenase [Ketobacter sp.]